MLNKLKHIWDVKAPFPDVVNINTGEHLILELAVYSDATPKTVTSGTLTVYLDGAEITSKVTTGQEVAGKAQVEVGIDYSTNDALPAGSYTYEWALAGTGFSTVATGRLYSKDISEGVVRNAVDSPLAKGAIQVSVLDDVDADLTAESTINDVITKLNAVIAALKG